MALTEEERGLIQLESDWIRPVVESMFDFVRLKHKVLLTLKGDSTRQVLVEKDILQIFATPERPYAKAVQDLERRGYFERTGQLPMPVVSLELADFSFDPSRYVRGHVRLQLNDDKTQIFYAEYPQPYNFVFQVDLRTRWKDGDSQLWSLMQQFQQKFDHGAAYIEVDMGPYGKKIQRMEVEGPQNTSDLDVGDNKERALRRTWTLSLQSWLVTPVQKVPTIRVVTLEELNAETGESLGITEVGNVKDCF